MGAPRFQSVKEKYMQDAAIIDVHSHAPGLQGAVSLAGTLNESIVAGWDSGKTLSMMERLGIAQSVLSPVPFSFEGLPEGEARKRARSINEDLASLLSRMPDRLGGFGLLPMANVEYAVEEAEYVLDVLKLDGVCMPTNVEGAYPGEPRFQPVFEALNRRGAVVFIHPSRPQVSDALLMGLDGATLEFMFDSTRMITSLVYNGVVRRCPNLKIITTHGGGVLPYIATRIATHAATRNAGRIPQTTPADVMEDLRSLYYDLTAAMNPMALASIVELVPKSHLLIGFDYPIRPERLYEGDLRALNACPVLSDADRTAIRRTNALALFPRLASSTNAISSA
jgi:6-methylsalicylate decarboxylase